MKILQILYVVAGLSLCTWAQADAAAEREAEKLLAHMDMEASMDASIAGMLDLQLQQNPALAPYKNVMVKFFKKYMSYDSIKGDMARIYADAFTAEELKELNAFYSTDVGKKTIQVMPELMVQGGQLGAQRVQANIGELQEMIAAESQRIQQLQQNQQ
ncbi:MAG: DUF2059 domain-containing protein [Halopseudomonas sp.]|uniref:DUF2059 domain-containing protein n=1 Tax=Halopseudomonas sp. TaxID=2901191 RepID=UPI003002DCAC